MDMAPNRIQVVDEFLDGLKDELMTIPELHAYGVLVHNIKRVCDDKATMMLHKYHSELDKQKEESNAKEKMVGE